MCLSVLGPILVRYNSPALYETAHSGMPALIPHSILSLERSCEPPSRRALCGLHSLSALTCKPWTAQMNSCALRRICIARVCYSPRSRAHICNSITVWLALYDCTHARPQSSTMREVLFQHSSILNTRNSSSSTLLHYVCSHSASVSL